MRPGPPGARPSRGAAGLAFVALQALAVPGCIGPPEIHRPPRPWPRAEVPAGARGGSAPAKITFVQAGFGRHGMDNRYLKASCGRCDAALEEPVEKCPNCAAQVRWRTTVRCEFCCDPEKLKVRGIEDKRGFCACCCGTGRDPGHRPALGRLPFGMSRTRPGRGPTGGAGSCPACKGSGGCNWCGKQGWLTVPDRFGK